MLVDAWPLLDEVRDVLQRPKFGLTSDQARTLIVTVHGVNRKKVLSA